jgi:oxygen-independent coproporphyrinogen III oxidase
MFGIYLHIPFCVSKCHYCDFYSEEIIPVRKHNLPTAANRNPNNIAEFTEHILKEIELRTAHYQFDKPVTSIFFGGGTPSLLTSIQIDRILNSLSDRFTFTDDIEITMECNPGTTSNEKLRNYRESGVNRLSFGAQSFIAEELNFLQRIHSASQITNSIEWARAAGFSNVSLDLMFSLPGQTENSLHYSLNEAIKLQPDHISAYSLIYEPETPLYDDLMAGKVVKLPDDDDAKLYDITKTELLNAGYIQYEVSNFARTSDLLCRHNLTYWSGDEYVAFGPSAHGYIYGKRYWNYRDNVRYFDMIGNDNLPVEGEETISREQKLTEIIFLGLRATGIDLRRIKQEFGIDLLGLNKALIDELVYTGDLVLNDNKLSLTSKGYSICDEIALRLVGNL